MELQAIDFSSTSFRYATDLRGKTPSLPTSGFDLIALHDAMNGIESFFEAIDAANQSMVDGINNDHDHDL